MLFQKGWNIWVMFYELKSIDNNSIEKTSRMSRWVCNVFQDDSHMLRFKLWLTIQIMICSNKLVCETVSGWFVKHVFASNCNLDASTLWNSNNSVQKALNLTIPAKNRRKMRIIDLSFWIKKLLSLASRLVWNWPSKLTTHQCVP